MNEDQINNLHLIALAIIIFCVFAISETFKEKNWKQFAISILIFCMSCVGILLTPFK